MPVNSRRRWASADLFGTATSDHADALHILDVAVPAPNVTVQFADAARVTEAALKQFEHYRSECPDFSANVNVQVATL